jgi:hypothetical protein
MATFFFEQELCWNHLPTSCSAAALATACSHSSILLAALLDYTTTAHCRTAYKQNGDNAAHKCVPKLSVLTALCSELSSISLYIVIYMLGGSCTTKAVKRLDHPGRHRVHWQHLWPLLRRSTQ